MKNFKKGDKVKLKKDIDSIQLVHDEIYTVTYVYENAPFPSVKLENKPGRFSFVIIEPVTLADIKIDDLTPEGYEFLCVSGIKYRPRGRAYRIINFDEQVKSFESYVEEYKKVELQVGSSLGNMIGPEHWRMKNKLGLLWNIVRDKGGTLLSLSNLLSMIFYETKARDYTGTETSLEVYEFLPESFIKSFR